MIFKILKYQLKDALRSRWIIVYGAFFLLLTELLFRFGGDESKTIIGLMNVVIILIPLVSIVYGVIYVYSKRDYIELLLSQPIKRNQLFTGIYLGLNIPMSLAYLIGITLPYFIHGSKNITVFSMLLLAGILLTFIFTGFAVLISLLFEEKSTGMGTAFIFWLLCSVIYDAIIMLLLWQFSEYPMEKIMIWLCVLNPVDLGRILIMLQFDTAALMGYTGAIFEKFFGSSLGILISISAMLFWIIVPFFTGLKVFAKKGF